MFKVSDKVVISYNASGFLSSYRGFRGRIITMDSVKKSANVLLQTGTIIAIGIDCLERTLL